MSPFAAAPAARKTATFVALALVFVAAEAVGAGATSTVTQTLTVRVTLERFDPLGGLVTRTVENSAQVRND